MSFFNKAFFPPETDFECIPQSPKENPFEGLAPSYYRKLDAHEIYDNQGKTDFYLGTINGFPVENRGKR